MGTVELYEFMIARCAPENLDDAYVRYADYEALERRLEEAQAAEKAAYENTDSVFHTLTKDCELLQRRLAEVEAERDNLRKVLIEISEWGCNGQCVELAGVQCPCCIAAAALQENRSNDRPRSK